MNIYVYCGSSNGKNPLYIEEARKLGYLMAKKDIGLVYGGASIGIMGALADSVLINGGNVYGVIPEILFSKEVAHRDVTRLIVVNTMHERKKQMEELADGFLTLPGGFGTCEELFEIITWNQLNLINKPIALVNINGFFDQLINFLDHSVENGFIRDSNREILRIGHSVEQSLEIIEAEMKIEN